MLDTIHAWQEKILPEYGLHFVHASDEWYILAGRDVPEEDNYDGYLQLENGVGMVRLLWEEFMDSVRQLKESGAVERWNGRRREISDGDGTHRISVYLPDGAGFGGDVSGAVRARQRDPQRLFGERITVTGLLTGQDIIAH